MTGTERALRSEQRGAIVVMALPIVLLLIGLLYYAIGIGDAIMRRETLQDAADASAFSAAVMMARGMNLVVLINVLMAMLIAVLVMIRIVQIAIATGIAICLLLATATMGASLGYVTPLRAGLEAANRAYTFAHRIVKPAVEGLHVTSLVIKHAMPVAMEARVVHTSRQYAPAALTGFAIPNQIALPIEPGTEGQLCTKAGGYAAWVGLLPLSPILPDVVEDELGDAFGAATGALAQFFCSFRGGNPPSIELPPQTLRQDLPKLPKTKQCEDQVTTDTQVDAEQQHVCDEAQAEVAASMPHLGSGACNHTDCSAYRLRTELARIECMPPGRPPLSAYVWQERDVTLRAQLHERRHPYPNLVEHLDPELGPPRLVRGVRAPCGRREGVSEAWNTNVAEPLCIEAHAPLHAEGPQQEAAPTLRVTYREVMQVLSCSRAVPRVTPDLERTPAGQSGSPLSTCVGQPSRRVHHNVKACAQLGDETFQLRAVLLGSAPNDSSRQTMETMLLRSKGEALPWHGVDLGEGLQQLSRVFVAQSEYYFDHDAASEVARDRLEWMWTMDWRARLVRFRLADGQSPDGCRGTGGSDPGREPSAQPGGRCGVSLPSASIHDACELAAGRERCATIHAALDVLNRLVLH